MKATRYITDENHILSQDNLAISRGGRDAEMQLVKVYPDFEYQSILGFGAAITESAGYVFSCMDDQQKIEFAQTCFGPGGNNYSLARISIQSCDFSLKPRAYVDKPFKNLEDLDQAFSLGQDLDYVVPLAKVAIAANPDIEFLASPWSPPAWAKTNRSMKSGGKLKSKYSDQWARIITRAIREYRDLGIPITRLTAQNEPCASQTWESCLFNSKTEGKFIYKSLKPALIAAGLDDIKILAWDHNKEHLLDRAAAFADHSKWLDAIDGFAFHWYSGDHFEALGAVRKFLGDDIELIFSEGCDAYSAGRRKDEIPHAEHYAGEIIGDLENGANAVFDWNVLLDMQGGPNHVGNFCDAPVMYDLKTSEMRIRLPFYYIGHFSRFMPPKSKRILSSSYTRGLETTACKRPDGSLSVVILNRTECDIEFALAFGGANEQIKNLCAPAHSIQTIIVC